MECIKDGNLYIECTWSIRTILSGEELGSLDSNVDIEDGVTYSTSHNASCKKLYPFQSH